MTVKIIQGDCRSTLPTLAAGSVQCCVTSPPYYGLRSYLPAGHPDKAREIGSESTPEQYIANLVDVFRHVRRVLRDDGVVWLNLGDSFIDKDLAGIPHEVARALRADGWYRRASIPWVKRNVMPASVTDRPTVSHESIFLLSKSARYFYDIDAVRVPGSLNSHGGAPMIGGGAKQVAMGQQINGRMGLVAGSDGRNRRTADWHDDALDDYEAALEAELAHLRGVRASGGMLSGPDGDPLALLVNTKPYSGAHFAVFPPKLVEPCINAGSRPGDTILDPFGGSGTVGQVATDIGRHAILCEIGADFVTLGEKRTGQQGLFSQKAS